MVRINAVFSEDTLKKIDLIAREEKKSRSNILREAAERLIDEYQRRIIEQQRKNKLRQAIKVQDRLRKKSGDWDGALEVRKWREFRK